MTCRRDFLCRCVSAVCTGIGLFSFFFARCFFRDLSCIPLVSCRRDYFLCFQHFLADRAVTSFRKSALFTCCLYCRIFYFRVTSCRDVFRLCISTICTSVSLYSYFFAGCFFRDLSCIPLVSCRRYCFLCFQYFFADGAVTSFRKAILFTCCLYCLIFYFCMTCRRDFLCLCISAVCTGIGLFSFFFTRCFFRDFSCIPTVTGCRDFFFIRVSTFLAGQFLSAARHTLGFIYNYCLIDMFMSAVILTENLSIINFFRRQLESIPLRFCSFESDNFQPCWPALFPKCIFTDACHTWRKFYAFQICTVKKSMCTYCCDSRRNIYFCDTCTSTKNSSIQNCNILRHRYTFKICATRKSIHFYFSDCIWKWCLFQICASIKCIRTDIVKFRRADNLF